MVLLLHTAGLQQASTSMSHKATCHWRGIAQLLRVPQLLLLLLLCCLHLCHPNGTSRTAGDKR
jgi:hypothetical protein